MRIVRIALGASALVAGLASAVFAQTSQPTTNPNTKVYAYKKSAQPNGGGQTGYSNTANQANRADLADPPPYGSPKWWEEKARLSNGSGGD
jgi:hypothetical protein